MAWHTESAVGQSERVTLTTLLFRPKVHQVFTEDEGCVLLVLG